MKAQQGFSLIELAIVLVIVTILVGGLAIPLSTQIEARRIAETRASMEVIHDALIGYAMSNTVNVGGVIRHYLPCPDTNNDGLEELRISGNCPSVRGGLPWITLGVNGGDAWGNRYTYAVAVKFANNSNLNGGFVSTPMSSTTAAELNILPNATCTASPVMSNLPAIWVSHGPRGRGAINMNGGAPLAPTSVASDERQNLNAATSSLPCANTSFVSHNPTDDFDDLVVWLSRNQLFNRSCPSGGCL